MMDDELLNEILNGPGCNVGMIGPITTKVQPGLAGEPPPALSDDPAPAPPPAAPVAAPPPPVPLSGGSTKQKRKKGGSEHRARRRTRKDRENLKNHLREAGVQDMKEFESAPSSGGYRKPSSSSGSRARDPKSIRLYLRREIRGHVSRFKFLRVEGLTQEEANSAASMVKGKRARNTQIGHKQPFGDDMPPLETMSSTTEKPWQKRIMEEALNFPTDLFSYQSITPTIKLVCERGRKSLENLSLEELCKAMKELQDVLRDAKRRGRAVRDRLVGLNVDLPRDDHYLSNEKLLEMIDEVDIRATLESAKEAKKLENLKPAIVTEPPPKAMELQDEAIIVPEEETIAVPKNKKDKKNRSRTSCHTAKGLWESWDGFWRFPDHTSVGNILKIRPLPPFFNGGARADSAFEIPKLGQAEQEKTEALKRAKMNSLGSAEDASLTTHTIHQRLLCCLLSEQPPPQQTKKDKQPEIDPAIRAILSGIGNGGAVSARSETSIKAPHLGPLSLDQYKSKQHTKKNADQRVTKELHAVDIIPSDSQVWTSLAARKDLELHLKLRDRQVRLYNQLEKNNKYKRQLLRSVSQAGIPMQAQHKIDQLREGYSELGRAYKTYKKKGIDSAQAAVLRALAKIKHQKKALGDRASIAGVNLDPNLVDGIPRPELKEHVRAWRRRKEDFESTHPPIELKIDMGGATSTNGDAGFSGAGPRSRLHSDSYLSAYHASTEIFSEPVQESSDEDDSSSMDEKDIKVPKSFGMVAGIRPAQRYEYP